MNSRRGRLAGIALVSALGLALMGTGGPATAADGPGGTHQGKQHGQQNRQSTYQQTNLVADVAGKAQVTDPHLVNPWGVSYGPTSPMWVSNNGTGTTTLYAGGIHGGTQTVNPLVVTIPGGAPTGQVANPTTDFVVHGADGSSAPARFIFVGATGHLTGWAPNVPAPAPSTNAQDAVVTPGAVFTGLAIAAAPGGSRLYAADFSAGTVDVYNGTYQRIITPGNFQDRSLPRGYSPFNVQVLNGKVYVTYAKVDRSTGRDLHAKGAGRVDVFDLDGTLLKRMPRHSALNAPWGLAIAPAGFGKLSGDLLVGNFGDGRIHAYDPATLRATGTLNDQHHKAIVIDGLWALTPGNGVEGGTDEVVFTAGPDGGTHGLLGTLALHE